MIQNFERFKLPPDFAPFNPRRAFRNYERNLPHWRQPGATYFLTFRLQDSLPQSVINELEVEREIWRCRIAAELARNDGKLCAQTDEDYEAFLVRRCRRIESVMDEGHGDCLLKQSLHREVVEKALLHFHDKRCDMHSFVVMPNHVHVAVRPLGEWHPEQLLHSWKRFTAREINAQRGQTGQLWQEDTWNRVVRNEEHWLRVMRYIVRNPVKAKLWNGESTVWVNPHVVGDDARLRENAFEEEPW